MILTLVIEKDNAKDCPYNCPFFDEGYGEKSKCTLFNTVLEQEVNTLERETVACLMCQNLYNKTYHKKI